MSEAMDLREARTMESLAEHIRAANDQGVQYKTISDESGVSRAQISVLANKGTAIMSTEKQADLWRWLDRYEARRAASSTPMTAPGEYKQALEIFPTASYKEAIGVCNFAAEERGIAIITGMPGVGKTTIVKQLPNILPHAVCMEAWPMMRLGDLLGDIASGIGIRVSGSQMTKVRQLEHALAGSDVTLVIDEAEMLRKWDNDKLEVLRKIWDHTQIGLIMLGTPKLLEIVNRMDTTQLSRRMYNVAMNGATAAEVRRELNAYNIDPDAADALARIAADTDHGGMGSYTMMMRLCLKFAAGGRITMPLLDEARHYKPGLRGRE